MVDIRVLFESLNVLFEAINWDITYLYDNAASARLFSAEVKFCCSSTAILTCWKPACVEFKLC